MYYYLIVYREKEAKRGGRSQKGSRRRGRPGRGVGNDSCQRKRVNLFLYSFYSIYFYLIDVFFFVALSKMITGISEEAYHLDI